MTSVLISSRFFGLNPALTPLVLLALVELGAQLVDGSLGMAHVVRP